MGLQPGSTVSLPVGTKVGLDAGTTVKLDPTSTVSLQPSSTVGLQPGSTVSLPVGTKVGLDAGTTVKVDPTSTISVRDVAAREAVQKAFTLSMNINDNNDVETFAVPSDKILVVEYLSCSLRVSSGESVYADLATTAGGVGALHSFFPGSSFQDGGVADKRFILSVSTRLYADPGTVVTLTVRRTVVGSASVPSFPCSLSGYYVDAT